MSIQQVNLCVLHLLFIIVTILAEPALVYVYMGQYVLVFPEKMDL